MLSTPIDHRAEYMLVSRVSNLRFACIALLSFAHAVSTSLLCHSLNSRACPPRFRNVLLSSCSGSNGTIPPLETKLGSSGSFIAVNSLVYAVWCCHVLRGFLSRHGVALAESLTRQGVTAKVYSVPEAGHTVRKNSDDGCCCCCNCCWSRPCCRRRRPRVHE